MDSTDVTRLYSFSEAVFTPYSKETCYAGCRNIYAGKDCSGKEHGCWYA